MAESIPRALQNVLHEELAAGERVVWYGQPAPTSRALRSAGTFLFGIPFFSFAAFFWWGAMFGGDAARHAADSFDLFGFLWGSIFVLAGTAMLLAPFWEWWVARHTLYAVTDRRALVIERPLGRSTVQGFSGDRLTDAIRREDILGRGELIFERVVSQGAKGRAVHRDVGFFGLADARGVASLLPVPAPAPIARAAATRDI